MPRASRGSPRESNGAVAFQIQAASTRPAGRREDPLRHGKGQGTQDRLVPDPVGGALAHPAAPDRGRGILAHPHRQRNRGSRAVRDPRTAVRPHQPARCPTRRNGRGREDDRRPRQSRARRGRGAQRDRAAGRRRGGGGAGGGGRGGGGVGGGGGGLGGGGGGRRAGRGRGGGGR